MFWAYWNTFLKMFFRIFKQSCCWHLLDVILGTNEIKQKNFIFKLSLWQARPYALSSYHGYISTYREADIKKLDLKRWNVYNLKHTIKWLQLTL
jgi:hypothetical protein